jgi:hypothetical protein
VQRGLLRVDGGGIEFFLDGGLDLEKSNKELELEEMQVVSPTTANPFPL